MRITRGNASFSSGETELSTKVDALVQRCLEAYRSVRRGLATVRAGRTRNPASSTNAPQPEGAPITERSDAVAALCDRLLREFDGPEVKAAEIRFVVHKGQHATHRRLDPESAAELSSGELVWELRRLIAWAGGTLADVAGTLETRAGDLDERGRDLLQDEVAAVHTDLGVLKQHLAAPVDWDAELEHLLSGEVAPFDDFAADDEDDSDG
jgi:hypothetical protein